MSSIFAHWHLKCPKTSPTRRILITVLAMFVVFISQRSPVQAQEKSPPVPVPGPATVAVAVAEANRFQVRVVGQGPDVILIPGLGSSSEVWSATMEVLQKSYRVHTVQVGGFATGASSAQVLSNYTEARIGRIRWLHEQTHARDKIRSLPAMVRNLMSRFLAKAVYRKNYLPFLTEI